MASVVSTLNLVFLLPVSRIPFAAAVLGDHDDEAIVLHLHVRTAGAHIAA